MFKKYPWISMDISTEIPWIWIWIWIGFFISTASLLARLTSMKVDTVSRNFE